MHLVNDHSVDPKELVEFIVRNAGIIINSKIMNAEIAEYYNEYAIKFNLKPPFVKVSDDNYRWDWNGYYGVV